MGTSALLGELVAEVETALAKSDNVELSASVVVIATEKKK